MGNDTAALRLGDKSCRVQDDMVLSKNRGPQYRPQKYYDPSYWDPQKGTPNFGKPLYVGLGVDGFPCVGFRV